MTLSGSVRRLQAAEPVQPSASAAERDSLDIFRLARDPARLRSSDVMSSLWPDAEYIESPDGALLVARVKIDGRVVLVLGQEKPKGNAYEAALRLNFGMMRPEGYAFATEMLARAENGGWAVLTLIDTPGADPSEHAATHLQSWRISECITAFCALRAPSVSVVLGEGGSGGALAMQVTDACLMMENALYSVIAPESCGSILFRDNTKIRESLDLLRPTALQMKRLGIIDTIIPEPREGARATDAAVLATIGEAIAHSLREVARTPIADLPPRRYQRVRHLGGFSIPHSGVKVSHRASLDEDVSKLTNGKLIDMTKSAEQDETGGIAHGYLVERLRRENRTTERLILCAPDHGGCGAYIDIAEYLEGWKTCRRCGAGEKLSVDEWASCLLDGGEYQELYGRLTVDDLDDDFEVTPRYRDQLDKARRTSGHAEALVVAEGAVRGMPAVVAISNFAFMGGSMGSVVGEKIARAVEHAIERDVPLVSVCCSGGARMQEGTLSLVQMARTNMALTRLAENRGLFISILANPTTGGSLASYVTRGDVILSEPGALVSFAGPRVMELSGFRVPPHVTTAEFLQERGGIHEIRPRRELAGAVARYLGMFYRLRSPRSPS